MRREKQSLSFFPNPTVKSLVASLLAILLGVLVGFVIMLFTNPAGAPAGLGKIFMGSLSHPRGAVIGIGQLLFRATPLIFTGLAVGFAFKTGLFNIGASGQYMMGIFVAMAIGIQGTALGVMQWPIALLAGGLAGAIWGAIPGIFKALFNVHEVITSIMFNWIAVYFINGLLRNVLGQALINPATNRSYPIAQTGRTPYAGLDKIFPNTGADLGIIIGIVACIIVYLILKKTVFGKELITVGLNKHAAKYAGVNEKKAIILSMTIAGFLAGIGGALFILAPSIRNLGNTYSVENNILNEGFDGITIALLGNSHPIGILFATFFVQYVKIGGQYMQSLGFKPEIVNVIIGIILYFSAFSLIVGRYAAKLFRRKSKDDESKQLEELSETALEGQPDEITTSHTHDKVSTEVHAGGDVK